ncbi:MAG: signal recognition particle-docking protein FtsY [Candidatus Woesearchaeota archaeon]
MFGFLKDKLKSLVSKFSKKVEAEGKEEVVEVEKEARKPVKAVKKAEKPAKKPVKEEKPKVVEKKPEVKVEKPRVGEEKPEVSVQKVKVAKPKVEPTKPRVEEKKAEVSVQKIEEEKSVEEKKGFFARIKEAITTKKISEKQFDEMFWEMELTLLENNAAVEVIEKIKSDLKSELVEKPIPRNRVEDAIVSSLRRSIADLFPVEPPDILKMVGKKKPFVICFVGVNGSGKTTSIAKVAYLLKQNGYSVVLAAADTFRAAAIDQLQLHADKLGVKLVRHDYGSDPAAVAFDAIKHAEANKKDVVLIDTAGRLHSNTNLMDEMKKIIRVAKPDLKLFVGESITGNDCVEQARQFDTAVGIDGIILAKADVDEKGGAAISVSYITKKPILYLGVGQEYSDLQAFDKDKLIASIGL